MSSSEGTPTTTNWTLVGHDTFSNEDYPVAGDYPTEAAALEAAAAWIAKIELSQPTARSGGQKPDGIQDRVYIARPDGTRYRYLPPGIQPDAE